MSTLLDRMAHTIMGDHYQPLRFVLLYLWRTVADSGVSSLRAVSVRLSLAALAAIRTAAAYAFGRTHALITGTLVANGAFFVRHAREARPYDLLMLLGARLLVLYLHVRGQRMATHGSPPSVSAMSTISGRA